MKHLLRSLYFFFVASAFYIQACKTDNHTVQKMPGKEYVSFVNDPSSGLQKEKTVGDFIFQIQYKPLEYVILQHLRDADPITPRLIEQEKKEVEGLHHFNFRIKSISGNEDVLQAGITDPNEYYARVQYFSFDMQKDLYLVNGTDTLPCVLFHFERTYQSTPYLTFVLGFEKKDTGSNGDMIFSYDDTVLGTGPIHLKIAAKDISNIPQLSE